MVTLSPIIQNSPSFILSHFMFTFLPILTLGCISMCFAFMLAIKDILPIISLGLIKHIITIMMTHITSSFIPIMS